MKMTALKTHIVAPTRLFLHVETVGIAVQSND